jgi:hypothetical protein
MEPPAWGKKKTTQMCVRGRNPFESFCLFKSIWKLGRFFRGLDNSNTKASEREFPD